MFENSHIIDVLVWLFIASLGLTAASAMRLTILLWKLANPRSDIPNWMEIRRAIVWFLSSMTVRYVISITILLWLIF